MNTEQTGFSLLELFRMGGIFMWPLLFFSIATIAIALERAIFIFRHNLGLTGLRERVLFHIRRRDITGAEQYLQGLSQSRMGARVFLALVRRTGLSESLIEKAAEAEALACINALENGFNFLTALGSLSPLTGFLGTVSGMIGAFKSIAEATEVNAQIVANGIYEALITTVFGLVIAIIAMISHSVFTHIVDKFAADLEISSADIITGLAVANSAPRLEIEDKTWFAGETLRQGPPPRNGAQ